MEALTKLILSLNCPILYSFDMRKAFDLEVINLDSGISMVIFCIVEKSFLIPHDVQPTVLGMKKSHNKSGIYIVQNAMVG